MSSKTVELFGGAMRVSIPETLVDESDFYPIPDNQEIFHNAETKQSLIIEIVEHVKESDMQGISPGLFYARDIAALNNAEFEVVVEPKDVTKDMAMLKNGVEECIFCQGMLRQQDKVLHLLVIRIPSKGSDVLVSMQSSSLPFPREILETFEILDWGLFV